MQISTCIDAIIVQKKIFKLIEFYTIENLQQIGRFQKDKLNEGDKKL